jgi:hypothetical protein
VHRTAPASARRTGSWEGAAAQPAAEMAGLPEGNPILTGIAQAPQALTKLAMVHPCTRFGSAPRSATVIGHRGVAAAGCGSGGGGVWTGDIEGCLGQQRVRSVGEQGAHECPHAACAIAAGAFAYRVMAAPTRTLQSEPTHRGPWRGTGRPHAGRASSEAVVECLLRVLRCALRRV